MPSGAVKFWSRRDHNEICGRGPAPDQATAWGKRGGPTSDPEMAQIEQNAAELSKSSADNALLINQVFSHELTDCELRSV